MRIQIKGRGTRLFTFTHGDGDTRCAVAKDGFVLFDFFANCEFFEEEFDSDQKLTLPKGDAPAAPIGGAGGGVRLDDFTNTSPDPMVSISRDKIGSGGMRIDREMYRQRFAQEATEAVANDAILRQAYDDEDWPAVEAQIGSLLFDRPAEFWNLAKLQDTYKTDRLPSLREILARVFGLIPSIPARAQLADEAFEKFVATQPTNAIRGRELRVVFEAFLLDVDSRLLLQDGKFGELRARDASLYESLSRLSQDEREALIAYLQAHVSLKDFEKVA